MATTQVSEPSNYEQVVQTILEWPPQARADLAQVIIRTLAPNTTTKPQQATNQDSEPRNRGAVIEWIRTRPKTGLPAPTDEEVAQWIDEYRMEKYG